MTLLYLYFVNMTISIRLPYLQHTKLALDVYWNVNHGCNPYAYSLSIHNIYGSHLFIKIINKVHWTLRDILHHMRHTAYVIHFVRILCNKFGSRYPPSRQPYTTCHGNIYRYMHFEINCKQL